MKYPLLWEWHFHKLLFLFPFVVEISFFHTKVCEMAPLIYEDDKVK